MGNKATKAHVESATNERIPFKFLFENKETTDEHSPRWKLSGLKTNDQIAKILDAELSYYQSIVARGVSGPAYRNGLGLGVLDSLFEFSPTDGRPNDDREPGMSPQRKQEFLQNELPNMVEEYQLFMLNLADQCKKTKKRARALNTVFSFRWLPISVQLLWRCHILHPASYHRDCMKHFGFLLSPVKDDVNVITKNAVHNVLYALRCSQDAAPNVSQMLHAASDDYIDWTKNWKSKIQYDAAEVNSKFTDLDFGVTVLKQLEFMKKANCTVWKEHLTQHLQAYVKQYVRFLQTAGKLLSSTGDVLQLPKKLATESLSPTYNIDLLWHTHMMYPSLYRKECRSITGGVMIDHDDLFEADDDEADSDGYWKYGRHGQFSYDHYVGVMMSARYQLLVMGFIANNCDNSNRSRIPYEIMRIVFDSYFDTGNIRETELSPEPPKVQVMRRQCKGGRMCCVGDHVNFE